MKPCPKCGDVLMEQPIVEYKGNFEIVVGRNVFCQNWLCNYEGDYPNERV